MENKREIKTCTVSGVIAFKDEFYKSGKYPYVPFVEAFRAKHKIPVAELRRFCQMVELFKGTNPELHHVLPNE